MHYAYSFYIVSLYGLVASCTTSDILYCLYLETKKLFFSCLSIRQMLHRVTPTFICFKPEMANIHAETSFSIWNPYNILKWIYSACCLIWHFYAILLPILFCLLTFESQLWCLKTEWAFSNVPAGIRLEQGDNDQEHNWCSHSHPCHPLCQAKRNCHMSSMGNSLRTLSRICKNEVMAARF